ncbi:MAG: cytochrome c [Acidimicrobiales bacterium]|nr:cytochrome c [Acidimicrobiales bacterium]
MTEIPEHLLKRSKERRAAIGGDDAPAAEATPGEAVEATATPAAAPAAAAPAAPAVPEPAPAPEPVRPEVAAALSRRKIPYWAMPVLAGLPLWAYVFWTTLEPPPGPTDTPLALGQQVYSGCSSCHGPTGDGGVGPAFDGVEETWPDYRDHMMWVRLGSTGWPEDTYGANDKPKNGGMPAFPSLSDEELAQVVLYERVAFGGMDPASPEAIELEEVAHGEKTFAEMELGPESAEAGVDPAELNGG